MTLPVAKITVIHLILCDYIITIRKDNGELPMLTGFLVMLINITSQDFYGN